MWHNEAMDITTEILEFSDTQTTGRVDHMKNTR